MTISARLGAALAAAFVVVGSASAFAADLSPRAYTKAPAPSPSYDWSGVYIGGQVGGASLSTQFKDFDDEFSNRGLSPDRKTRFTGGGYGGVNWQFGSFVVGVDAQWSHYNATVESLPFGEDFPDFQMGVKLNNAGSVKARFGLAFTNTLVYVAAGPAWANATFSVHDGANGDGSPFIVSSRRTVNGLAAAAGVEHMITPNWIVRGQFQYDEYETQELKFDLSPRESGTPSVRFGQQSSVLEATFGVSYKIGPTSAGY